MALKIQKIDNSPAGWAKLAPGWKPGTALTAEVEMEGQVDDGQLFNLRGCFVQLDRLERRYGGRVPFTLRVLVNSEADAYRVHHYLAVMTQMKRISLEVYCEGERVWGRRGMGDNYYRIVPLFCVGAEENKWTVRYLTMAEPGDENEVKRQVELSFGGKSPAQERTSLKDLLDGIYMGVLWNLQREIAGTDEASMKDEEKKSLRKELREVLTKEMPRLGRLGRLLWAMFLRSLSDSGSLFYRDRGGGWHMDRETLRCTRLDAASYAEGFLQLMENACIHSEMRRAYISFRLSDIDITGSGVLRVASAAQTRAALSKRCRRLCTKSREETEQEEAQGSVPRYELSRQAKFCLEMTILNDSIGRSPDAGDRELWGVSRMFAKNRGKEWDGIKLKDVFDYQCEKMRDISKHYGLRLLEKTVQVNEGFFSVSSPGKGDELERYSSFYSKEIKRVSFESSGQGDPCTDYYILLPLFPHWHEVPVREASTPPKGLFQKETLTRPERRQRVLRFHASALEGGAGMPSKPLFSQEEQLLGPEEASGGRWGEAVWDRGDWLQAKEDMIERIWGELVGVIDQEPEEDLWLLDLMQVWDVLSLELMAKAVFRLVAWWKSRKRADMKLALLLPGEMFTSEFIRIFSIFYDKQLSEVTWMGTTQIALCGYQEGGDGFPQVHFLLAGATSGSARITARTFTYYNTGTALSMMPQIRYLTRQEAGEPISQFPFDLFLSAVPAAQQGEEKGSWFLRRMDRALNQGLWHRPHGCRLGGIRVRLRSNIYLSDFYEAELLFHNVGIIYRFAHLIAMDLLRQAGDREADRPLVVVGYEFYSSVLIEQIVRLLEGWKVHYLIYSSGQEGDRLHLSPCLQAMEDGEREKALHGAECVVVIPIGTTMSTLYQIVGEMEAQWQCRFPYDNYVLMLVREREESDLSRRYWALKPAEPDHVRLRPQRRGEDGLCCRYFLDPRTQWSDVAQDADGQGVNEEVLVYVDQTSTRPKDIFVVEGSRFKGISHFLNTPAARAENDRRLELFKGLTHYGHIVEGNNHFQFYLDMDRYFYRAQQEVSGKNKQTVDQWLQSLRGKINPNAYNIIVSPLHTEDSPFAKAVIDQVFEHSLRFIHMDLTTAFREDVRAKFSYIADEYREIRSFDRSKPVNVYFVNTAITSGGSLARARNLVTMLMEEAGVEYDRESVFKGCFVLVNRSAFDTLNSYVKEPEEHFWAYLHLAVPALNSRRDRCPTCELLEQYRTLEYSCAGNRLGQEFRRLRIKHARRTMKEYRAWLGDTVMSSGGYAGWLRQWLYSYVNTSRKKGKRLWAGIFEVTQKQHRDLTALYDLLQWGIGRCLKERGVSGEELSEQEKEDYLNAVNNFSLQNLKAMVEADPEGAKKAVGGREHCLEPEYWRRVLVDYVCGQKTHLRMVATHRAFLKMDTVVERMESEIPARGRQMTKLLAGLIEDELKQAAPQRLQAEWLISYLKVLSRPHLAQYHHIRQGILTLMLQMTDYAIGGCESLPQELEFAKPFLREGNDSEVGALARCQVLQTLLKRLAGLQSTYFLYAENMERVMKTFDGLREEFLKCPAEYQLCNPMPTREQVAQNMVKLVKWTSSCGDDENGCHLIESSFLEKGEK